jgi:hypothetical protein
MARRTVSQFDLVEAMGEGERVLIAAQILVVGKRAD